MGKRVLLVDNAAFMRMMLRDILKKAGYEIAGECSNCAEGLKQALLLAPDVVISEIVTGGGLDGIEMTKRIVKEKPETAVIICSGMTQEAMQLEAFRAGAKGFLRKPFQTETVLHKVREALGA